VWLWWRPIWRPGTAMRRDSFGPLLRFAASVAAIRLVDFISSRSIELLIVGAHGVAALGLYAVGAKVYQVALQSISSSVLDVAMSAMSRLAADLARVRGAYLAAVQISAYVAAPAFVGGAALAPELVRVLFGARWTDAEPIMRLLLLLGAVQCLQFFNGTCLNALGRPRLTLMVNLIRMVVVLCVLTLFPGRDAYGMTIAYVGALLLMGPLSHVITWRVLELGRWELPSRVWPPLLCSAIGFVAVELARAPLASRVGSAALQLPLLGLLYVLVLALVMLLFLRPQLLTVWTLFRGRRG
jgi:O-antigen/teichoic acid export membrane protein